MDEVAYMKEFAASNDLEPHLCFYRNGVCWYTCLVPLSVREEHDLGLSRTPFDLELAIDLFKKSTKEFSSIDFGEGLILIVIVPSHTESQDADKS